MRSAHLKQSGFTLIELLIAICIVGILAAIAYPAYIQQMKFPRRSDGQAIFNEFSAYLESYYTENNSYTGVSSANLGLTNTSQEGYYQLALTTITATTFTITRQPRWWRGAC